MKLLLAMQRMMEISLRGTPENPSDCPFCGAFHCEIIEETQMWWNEAIEFYAVECMICQGRAGFSEIKEKAWELWNHRKNMSPVCPQEH